MLRGAIGSYHEQAMKLLKRCDYNFTMAKFHVLYPELMVHLSEEQVFSYLQNKYDLDSVVQSAVVDLIGSSQDEIQDIVDAFRTEVEKKMNIEQLGHYEAVFEKMQSAIPDDV